MESVTATAARKDLYGLIRSVTDDCTPVAITSSKGKDAVLVGEDEWSAIEETLYLMGVPGLAESFLEDKAEPVCDCAAADGLEW